ncbi:MAG: Y-family DNA polymerase [Candidatus Binataceae bacterium]
MSRIVSVWLRSWPITRLLKAQAKTASGSQSEAADPERPLVLVAPGKGGQRIVALNRVAERCGLMAGELLSNARSKVIDLQSRDADPAADDAALRRLSQWCQRYTPLVALWSEENGADGLFLDITGGAHLFGGEESLLADLADRLRRFGLYPRLAIADTPGAAWAIARYGNADSMIVPSGEEESALGGLPLAALRLPEETRTVLCRLGFRRIGELIRQPRAPLASRLGVQFLRCLDQALGRAPEPLSLLAPQPAYRAHAMFAEAITMQAHVVEVATRLLRDLAKDLARDGVGTRKLRLILFRTDGKVLPLDIGLAAPSRDVEHIARLIALRLEHMTGALEGDIGFDAVGLHVLTAESMPERQIFLAGVDEIADSTGLARLIDRLEQRLGEGAVRRLHPQQSHIPERAILVRRAVDGLPSDWAIDYPCQPRPLFLLPRPEDAEVTALVPEGPPRQFIWRGIMHHVAQAEGPERIAPEWWRQLNNEVERDYYMVEDAAGRCFWLYRAGLYRQGSTRLRWFVHGVFP